MAITFDTPLALYAIPVAFFVGLQPHVQKLMILQSVGLKVDNLNPREMEAKAIKKGVPEDTMLKIKRCAAAHSNGHEVFPVFVAALLSGQLAGFDSKTLNIFAATFLACRVGYSIVYVNQSTPAVATVRSGLYWGGMSYAIYILVQAGNAMRTKTLL